MFLSEIKHLGKLALRPHYRRSYLATKKLLNTPRYTRSFTNILGAEIELVDSASFLFMYKEIFEQQIYKFKSKEAQPLIIDCGANIGLSILYFKRLYPNSYVVGFEPDINVFNVLKNNIQRLRLSGIELIDKAVWTSETTLEFMAEGADGGRLMQHEPDKEKYQVSTIRLRDYLSKKVDFLKLDIEGAETEVIKDCQDLLVNVDNLFVEYHSFANQPQTLHIIINILTKAGYRLHVHQMRPSLQPFYQCDVYSGMDMILNIFAFREDKF
ncbi:FkbM family methyltransferase [Aerosakkonema funiforme]|uniref:FkbM family methyltransferase n=2 Tax=Oscillatoriophycideae TaxID=1301283 RepID=A0A926V9M6_9CYAN|nr:FkbM family methyltransferase [Aerosakkonema funiforme]MBD2179747.1 FkbM family methyltransferase [Aerosakkonema funiforme FACHB-1375]